MVNFPAPQKLDPKISRHGIHTVCDSVCGAGKFLPHKNSTPRYHPMVFTLCMTVFVGQEMVNFPAPQKPDPKPQNRAKTVVFSMFMQNPKQQTWQKHRYLRHFRNTTCPKCCILQCFWELVFTVLCENTCMKHRKYQRNQRWHFPWQQAAKSKNADIYSVSAQWFFQKKIIFGPFLASEASQNKETWVPPQDCLTQFRGFFAKHWSKFRFGAWICKDDLLKPEQEPFKKRHVVVAGIHHGLLLA